QATRAKRRNFIGNPLPKRSDSTLPSGIFGTEGQVARGQGQTQLLACPPGAGYPDGEGGDYWRNCHSSMKRESSGSFSTNDSILPFSVLTPEMSRSSWTILLCPLRTDTKNTCPLSKSKCTLLIITRPLFPSLV